MIFLHLPWLPIALLAIFLCTVFVREFFLASSFSPGDPERGMAIFNLWVLALTILSTIFCTHFLYAHEQIFEKKFTPYHGSRYAPELEIFREGVFNKTWIYVSDDSALAVVSYYNELSKIKNFNIISDTSSTSSTKLLFVLPNDNIFLTIKSERNRLVLFYSEEGEVRTVLSPSGGR